jgi:hypothetical protein
VCNFPLEFCLQMAKVASLEVDGMITPLDFNFKKTLASIQSLTLHILCLLSNHVFWLLRRRYSRNCTALLRDHKGTQHFGVCRIRKNHLRTEVTQCFTLWIIRSSCSLPGPRTRNNPGDAKKRPSADQA